MRSLSCMGRVDVSTPPFVADLQVQEQRHALDAEDSRSYGSILSGASAN
jgi:hypothetical protein